MAIAAKPESKATHAAKCPTCAQSVRLVYVAGGDALNFHMNAAGNICGGSYAAVQR